MAESQNCTAAEFDAQARQETAEELQSIEGHYRYIGMSPTPEQDALQAFFNYTINEESRERIELGVVGCLADALASWVTLGDATDVCPNYELYLQVAICIIAIWNGEGGWLHSNIEIPLREPNPHDRDDLALPTLVRPGSQVQIWNHPAFRRDTFEYARQKRAQFCAKQ